MLVSSHVELTQEELDAKFQRVMFSSYKRMLTAQPKTTKHAFQFGYIFTNIEDQDLRNEGLEKLRPHRFTTVNGWFVPGEDGARDAYSGITGPLNDQIVQHGLPDFISDEEFLKQLEADVEEIDFTNSGVSMNKPS